MPTRAKYTRRKDLSDDKLCSKCGETKPLSEFSNAPSRSGGIVPYCKSCEYIKNKNWRDANREKVAAVHKASYARQQQINPIVFKMRDLLNRCRKRCALRNISFDLDLEYLLSITGTHCPVLGIKYDFAGRVRANNNAPSLDRFEGPLGYVRGNVNVISWRANRMKLDASPEELRKLAKWATRMEQERLSAKVPNIQRFRLVG